MNLKAVVYNEKKKRLCFLLEEDVVIGDSNTSHCSDTKLTLEVELVFNNVDLDISVFEIHASCEYLNEFKISWSMFQRLFYEGIDYKKGFFKSIFDWKEVDGVFSLVLKCRNLTKKKDFDSIVNLDFSYSSVNYKIHMVPRKEYKFKFIYLYSYKYDTAKVYRRRFKARALQKRKKYK